MTQRTGAAGASRYGGAMRRILIPLVLLAVLGAVLAACGTEESERAKGETSLTVLDERNREARLSVGTTFAITLPVTPGTGYRWEADLPMGYVQVSDEIAPTDGDAVGQSTMQTWVIRPEVEGTAELTYRLMPPGDGNAEQIVTFTADVSP